jgi:hypothetical protein
MQRTAGLTMVLALVAVLAPASEAAPANPPRESQTCLQNNRIWGWRAPDQRTLVLTDINSRRFLVKLSGGCIGLNDAILALQIRTTTNLGCLMRGDRVSYRAPALGEMTCFVDEVQPYASNPKEQYDHPYNGNR